MSPRIITLLTDFGTADAYVGIMKGVILGICPAATIVDLTHDIPPQDVTAGALVLRSATRYFSTDAIHVAVVDPEVGSARGAVLVQTASASFIGPDNGLLEPAARELGIERILSLARTEYHLTPVSRTFHGRDVFAPVAAHLASGVSPELFGPAATDLVELPLPVPTHAADGVVGGVVIHIDRFGNLVTNVAPSDLASFPASALSVSIAGCAPIPLVSTYAEAAAGGVVALVGSWDRLEIAVRGGSAAQRLGARVGTAVHVRSI